MDWQKLKTLLNDPLVLLEKVVKKEVEGPKPGAQSLFLCVVRGVRDSQNLYNLTVLFTLFLAIAVSPWQCDVQRFVQFDGMFFSVNMPRKDVPPEHLHNFILQMASPAEMDAEKAKDHNSCATTLEHVWKELSTTTLRQRVSHKENV